MTEKTGLIVKRPFKVTNMFPTNRYHLQNRFACTYIPFNERKCRTCLNCLEDEFHFLTRMSVVPRIKKKTYIKPYYWKRLNMPKFIELIKKTENKIEIRNLSMFIMKSFEIRTKTFILISMHHASFLYIHVVDLLICNCIYNKGR